MFSILIIAEENSTVHLTVDTLEIMFLSLFLQCHPRMEPSGSTKHVGPTQKWTW